MSSNFSLQQPYVLASLPKPVNHSNGRYVAGEVFSGVAGTKKRKRSELAIGIDGEGVNIYDIASSKLATSYALPPQSSFTCPPASFRTRISKSKSERRTYVSTTGTQALLSLFHETTEGSAPIASVPTTKQVEDSKSPIVFLGTITAPRGTDTTENKLDLLVVKEDGEIQCYDGESLNKNWASAATALSRDSTFIDDRIVESVQLTTAVSASQGILKGRQDVLAIFPQEISESGFNPEIVVIVTSSTKLQKRTLHVTSFPRRAGNQLNGASSQIETLLSVDIPWHGTNAHSAKPVFSLHPSNGTLQQLSGDVLYTFDLTESLPKMTSRIKSAGTQSFLRLSATSIMLSSGSTFSVYNPKYQSLLATVEFEGPTNGEHEGGVKSDSLKRKRNASVNGKGSHACEFITYFPKSCIATAISDSNLIAIQIEVQQDRHGRPRSTGLLIDSIGRSGKEQSRRGKPRPLVNLDMKTLDEYLPGSAAIPESSWTEQTKLSDAAVASKDVATFEKLLAVHLGSEWPEASQANGVRKCPPSDVDRRWILYSLSKIFTIVEEEGEQRLSIVFYPPNVFTWLLTTGNMSILNIQMALKYSLDSSSQYQDGDLVDLLVEMDPDMDLLLALLANNYLGATELLHALRRLMESLGLFGEDPSTKQQLLTSGEEENVESADPEDQLKILEAQVEDDLAVAEYQLGAGSGVRGQALSLGLSKLYTCPSTAITVALQTTFSAAEITSLIHLLRFELARGAWTSRYLDNDQAEIIDEEADIPNNAIVLISSLLNNCVDAIGAGGWISGDARLVNGDPFEAEELVASLKLEVSAALEGIEEGEYLRGLTTEMVRFSGKVSKAQPSERKGKMPEIMAVPANAQQKLLPLGLKADKPISQLRVGAGGEIQRRTARDIGHLKSQQVGKYSLERIVV